MESRIYPCPYCGEENEALIERIASDQCYIEDCRVCCRPITLKITSHPKIILEVKRDDE
ncbi:MAG: CPXCG motif-containing cysteine-rich protein [Candidatus Thiodiazotropha sp.]